MTVDLRPPGIDTAFRNFTYEEELDRIKRSGLSGGGGGGSIAEVPIEAWKVVNQAGGAAPAFQNGWNHLNASYQVMYRKRPDGVVEMRGLMKPGAINTTAFTMPTGYWPASGSLEPYFACPVYTGSTHTDGGVYVNATNGNVIPYYSTGGITATGYIALAPVRYSTDQAAFPTGPAGPTGATGPQGPAGGNAAVPMDTWHVVNGVGEPPILSGFANLGGVYDVMAFRKYPDGKVRLRGMAGGGSGNILFKLPAGYLPPGYMVFTSITDAARTRIDIDQAGNVTLVEGNRGFISLAQIEFDTGTVTQLPTGPQGPQGPAGAAGATGPPGTSAAATSWKQSCRAATTANITLSGTQTVDNVALIAGDRVLVKNQTTAAANGIYVVAAGAWARATDADDWTKLTGATINVEQGNTYPDTLWSLDVNRGGTLGTTAITPRILPSNIAMAGDYPGDVLPGNATLATISQQNISYDTISANDQRISDLSTPVTTYDAANKLYVDSVAGGGSWKASCRVVTDSNITLSGLQTIDGVPLVAGDRVLVKNQSGGGSANGIYVVAAGAWARSTDANTWAKLVGAVVYVEQGGSPNYYGDTIWRNSADKVGTLGTTALIWNVVPSKLGVGTGEYGTAMTGSASLSSIGQNNPAYQDVSVNGQRIVTLGPPQVSDDAATKFYVDTVAQGLDAKNSVRAATTSPITLSGTQMIDSVVSVVAGDRVLVKSQAAAKDNGIYIVAAGAWTRAPDMDTWAEVVGSYVFVEDGYTNVSTGWVNTNLPGGTIGTTNMYFTQFSGAGQINPGTGLTKTGNTIDVGAGAGISVAADSVGIAFNGINAGMLGIGSIILSGSAVVSVLPIDKGGTDAQSAGGARTNLGAAGYYSSATHSAGMTITITQSTHLLRASRGLIVQVQNEATGAVEFADTVVSATGDVTVTFGASVTANSKRITIMG